MNFSKTFSKMFWVAYSVTVMKIIMKRETKGFLKATNLYKNLQNRKITINFGTCLTLFKD